MQPLNEKPETPSPMGSSLNGVKAKAPCNTQAHLFKDNVLRHLLASRNSRGVWEGELSSSALSTATAMFAFHMIDPFRFQPEISKAAQWLQQSQNQDGGWGDTILSGSNVSTTLLVWTALSQFSLDNPLSQQKAEAWITEKCGSLEPSHLIKALLDIYKQDHTFSVPILTMLALGQKLGDTPWNQIPSLPFELAALPQGMFKFFNMQVVSYAMPALIAMGQVLFLHQDKSFFTRLIRRSVRNRTLTVLGKLQPENGGFLEAVPLTSFVLMSLAGMHLSSHYVVVRGIDFLQKRQRSDGSWPIDTHLETWATTLSINAIGPELDALLPKEQQNHLKAYILNQQYRIRHPFTGANPGGWAWTPLPGGVPDADDTSSALIALAHLAQDDWEPIREPIHLGLKWLIDLQNRDGGLPTFCRGWGRLPFDQSSPDITAHAVQALALWAQHGVIIRGLQPCLASAIRFLEKRQRPDGSWVPLWFGNENLPQNENPFYGTSRVMGALRVAMSLLAGDLGERVKIMLNNGRNWLHKHQNNDGSWGKGNRTDQKTCSGTVEETALALSALSSSIDPDISSIRKGWNSLVRQTQNGTIFPASPIGFYFANLWYFERHYPVVFTLDAINVITRFGYEAQMQSHGGQHLV